MSDKNTPLKERMTQLLSSLNEGLIERDETMAIVLLAALSGQNIFLYGPPGTAKSLIARRVSKVFKSKKYFECLMQKFTTPEEIFGPFSIKQMQDGKYERLVEGYLPEADIAFLDEIWKSSPAILNNLLTIINEKKFRNGVEVKNVPLKFLVSASNEIPPENLGLEALYDRFLVRLVVNRIESWDNFEKMLKQPSTSEDIAIDESLRITDEEYSKWATGIEKIAVSPDSLNVIKAIKAAIAKYNKGKSEAEIIYISDRRWQRAVHLMKASAFFCDRKETNVADCLLLTYCLWAKIETRSEIVKYVEDAVKNNSVSFSSKLPELKAKADELEEKINKNLYYSSDIYDTVSIPDEKGNPRECIRARIKYGTGYGAKKSLDIYLPFKRVLSSNDNFYPLDKQGNELTDFNALVQNKVCTVKYGGRYGYPCEPSSIKPVVKYAKGSKKEDEEGFITNGLNDKCDKLTKEFDSLVDKLEKKLREMKSELRSPFLPDNDLNIALNGLSKLYEDATTARKNCDRLHDMINA